MNEEAIMSELRQYIQSRIEQRKAEVVRETIQEMKDRRTSSVRDAVSGQVEASVMRSIENSGGVDGNPDQ